MFRCLRMFVYRFIVMFMMIIRVCLFVVELEGDSLSMMLFFVDKLINFILLDINKIFFFVMNIIIC